MLGICFEIFELANFSGWMIAEDLDAAMLFWLHADGASAVDVTMVVLMLLREENFGL